MVNIYLVAKASEENPANITECTAPNNFTKRIVKFTLNLHLFIIKIFKDDFIEQ